MIVEHPINELKNHISGWYIDTALCDEILAECNKKKILFEKDGATWRNYSYTYLDLVSNKYYNIYKDIINQCLEQYKVQYPFLKECPPLRYQRKDKTEIDNCKIQKYKPGNYYNALHCENDGMYPFRVLAFMTYLDNLEDGGTDYPLQHFKTNSEKGLTLIWPASFTHPHIGIPALTATKTIITGWFEWAMY